MSLLKQSETYKKQLCQQPEGGVVVFYGAEIQGWKHELGEANCWIKGCVAVDATGQQWQAVGGNDYDGADHWALIE